MGFFHRSPAPKTAPGAPLRQPNRNDWLNEIEFRERLFDEIRASDGQQVPCEVLTFAEIVPPETQDDIGRFEGFVHATIDKVRVRRRVPREAGRVTERAVKWEVPVDSLEREVGPSPDPIVGADGQFFVRRSGAKYLGVGEVALPPMKGYNNPQDESR